ncbi:hypothetical protein AGMMS49992_29730 [Clostridia bacterium]|nr:hypothetical protein AGMMS49992_29730 [Clostridia bacterium]
MAEASGFFNSIQDDRVYQAEDFAAFYGDLFTNGVFYNEPDTLQVTPGSAMSVYVAAGSAMINGYRYYNRGVTELTVVPSDANFTRIDRIVVRWDLVARACYLAVLTGGLTNAPSAPELTRNTQVWELGIAEVMVPRASGLVEAGNIIDTRLNPSVCGAARTHTYLTYGEADTEALVNSMQSVLSRVSRLENMNIFTTRQTINVIIENFITDGSNYPNKTTPGMARGTLTDERFHPGQLLVFLSAKNVSTGDSTKRVGGGVFSAQSVSEGKCTIIGYVDYGTAIGTYAGTFNITYDITILAIDNG